MKPKKTVVIDQATRTRTEIFDYLGLDELASRPELVECDFCGRRSDRLWLHPTRPFALEMWRDRTLKFDGVHWCSCVFCNPMVDARDIPLLLARVTIVNESTKGVPVDGYQRLYTAVFAAMYDAPARMWNAGDVWPVSEVR